MSRFVWSPLFRHVCFLGCAGLLGGTLAAAQSAVATDSSSTQGWSSSQSIVPTESQTGSRPGQMQLAEGSAPASPAALPSAPARAQDQDNTYSGWHGHDVIHRLTFEAGGGFNAPISNSVTYGGNFTVGGGVNFSRNVAALIEYQFLDDKLPGALIAETNGQATGGHTHIWSFTIDPVIDLFPKASNDIYVTGGGGFYRKVTTFTFPEATEFCTYFYCGIGYVPGTVGHFSSNQGGFNIGGGYQHRFGGMYGQSKTRFFAEVRYLDVLSPAVIGKSANGLPPVTIDADTKVLPVTFGIRW